MHDHQKPLARTGGLDLIDGADKLTASIRLPDTTDGRDTRALLSRGILRGLSVEMRIEWNRFEGHQRIVEKAELMGLGVVDRPAYKLSTAALKQWADIVDRASFSGSYDYVETISDTGSVRKRRYQPGAFDRSINDPDQDIGLLTSRNPTDAIASKLSGTLAIERDADRVSVVASNVANTAAWDDLLAKREAGLTLGP